MNQHESPEVVESSDANLEQSLEGYGQGMRDDVELEFQSEEEKNHKMLLKDVIEAKPTDPIS